VAIICKYQVVGISVRIGQKELPRSWYWAILNFRSALGNKSA